MAEDESEISKPQDPVWNLSPFLYPVPKSDPQPPMSSTDEETYGLCLTPRAALARFPYNLQTAFVQLERELVEDRVQGVAQEAIWQDGDVRETGRLTIIPAWIWKTQTFRPESDFWDTGYIEAWFDPTPDFPRRRSLKFFGVKFWPDALPAIAEPPADEALPLRRQDMPVLPPRIAEAWMAWFKAQPNPTKQRAEDGAVHMFPNHNLSRERVRELFDETP